MGNELMRRVRASFLLRCVISAASIAAFLGVLQLGAAVGWTIGFIIFLATFWIVGVEGGLLPLLIEHVVVGRARKTGKPVGSIWFVDVDRQERRMMDSFHDDTRDNPTIR